MPYQGRKAGRGRFPWVCGAFLPKASKRLSTHTMGGKTKAYKFSHSARSMPESRRILDKRLVPMSALWGVGYTNGLQSLPHELVFAAGVGPFKSHPPKIEYEIQATDRAESRHQATSRTTRSMPSRIGTGNWRDKRKRSHSSSTSSSSSRQSSKETASAQTPSKPGMEP